MQIFCVLGALPSDPRDFSGWGVCSQNPKTSLIVNFWLRAWCFYCYTVILCKLILRLAAGYGFAQVALSLNKFAHPWNKIMLKAKSFAGAKLAHQSKSQNDGNQQTKQTLRYVLL